MPSSSKRTLPASRRPVHAVSPGRVRRVRPAHGGAATSARLDDNRRLRGGPGTVSSRQRTSPVASETPVARGRPRHVGPTSQGRGVRNQRSSTVTPATGRPSSFTRTSRSQGISVGRPRAGTLSSWGPASCAVDPSREPDRSARTRSNPVSVGPAAPPADVPSPSSMLGPVRTVGSMAQRTTSTPTIKTASTIALALSWREPRDSMGRG